MIKRDCDCDSTVHALEIESYLSWAGGVACVDTPLTLPSIQRGFVWKPKQIQDLWDSLLRGMPIGAVLVEKFASQKGRSVSSSPSELINVSSGWHLLDGQQRTLSMLLGFPTKEIQNHRLWIDFHPHHLDNETLFQFRVTTASKPFGYQAKGQGLSLSDRRKAREKVRVKFGDKITNETTNEHLFHEVRVKPYKSKNQAYLFLVSELWNISDESTVLERIKEKLEDGDDLITPKVEKSIKNFIEGIKSLKKQSIALIEVRQPNDDIKNEKQNFLTLLFDRISRNGTTLNSEDLLFSMIKQKWPEAHNLVFKLHEAVGTMMKPTDFIMTAYRLSATKVGREGDSEITDTAKPTIKDFYKNLPILLGDESKPGELRILISGDKFKSLFEKLKKTISYEGDNDIGLPEALLAYVSRPLLQVLIYWCMDNENSIKESRKQLIQFILFWMVASPLGGNASREILKASEECFNLIKKNDLRGFPLESLIALLTKSESGKFQSLLPELPMASLGMAEKGGFRDPEERSQYFCGSDGGDLYRQFKKRKRLLLWFQRKWVKEKFKGTQFLSGQDGDSVPYDFDHLVPQSNWSSFQGRGNALSQLEGPCKNFNETWPRRGLGNSIGNYRVMSDSDNRSRGDTPLTEKVGEPCLSFLENKGDWEKYAFADTNNSANDLSKWKLASPLREDSGNWNNARVLAFQDAVEGRVVYLYNKLMSDSGLKNIIKELKG